MLLSYESLIQIRHIMHRLSKLSKITSMLSTNFYIIYKSKKEKENNYILMLLRWFLHKISDNDL